MLAKYFPIIRNYVLSVSSQRKYNFYHQNTLLDAFRTNSRNIIGMLAWLKCPHQPLSKGTLVRKDSTQKYFNFSMTTNKTLTAMKFPFYYWYKSNTFALTIFLLLQSRFFLLTPSLFHFSFPPLFWGSYLHYRKD